MAVVPPWITQYGSQYTQFKADKMLFDLKLIVTVPMLSHLTACNVISRHFKGKGEMFITHLGHKCTAAILCQTPSSSSTEELHLSLCQALGCS